MLAFATQNRRTIGLGLLVSFLVVNCAVPAAGQSSKNVQAPEEGEKAATLDALTRIESMISEAMLAEKNNPADSSKYWFRLADVEAIEGHLTEAIEHVNRGLITYFPIGGVSRFTPITPILSRHSLLIKKLIEKREIETAIDLLKQASRTISESYGSRSIELASQEKELFLLYLDSKNESEAFKTLDCILRFGLPVLHDSSVWSPIDSIGGAADKLTEHGQEELARKILTKVIKAQRKGLDPRDKNIATTNLRLAKIEHDSGNSLHAEKYIRKAIKINKLYYSEKGALCNVAGVFPEILRANGKDGEATEVERLKKYQSLKWPFDSAILGRHFDVERSPRTPLSEFNQSERLSLASNELKLATREAPYSSRTRDALLEMLGLANQMKDWRLKLKIASRLVDYVNHVDVPARGDYTGCTPSDLYQNAPYEEAVDACIKLKASTEGSEAIKTFDRELSTLTPFEYYNLAGAALESGDQELAIHNLKKINSFGPSYKCWNNVSFLWKRLGKEDEGKKAKEKLLEEERRYRYSL